MPIADFFPPRPDLTPTIDAGKRPAGAGLLPVGGVGRSEARRWNRTPSDC
jgi:hypothetical protein